MLFSGLTSELVFLGGIAMFTEIYPDFLKLLTTETKFIRNLQIVGESYLERQRLSPQCR
jgi:hypothetical protein